jgi:predicted ATPase
MIKRWSVENFKSIQKADLELFPLTIFAGANNSGKSSFLQSILLFSQTLNVNNHKDDSTLIPFGDLLKLGNFSELINKGTSGNIKIGFDYVDRDYPVAYLGGIDLPSDAWEGRVELDINTNNALDNGSFKCKCPRSKCKEYKDYIELTVKKDHNSGQKSLHCFHMEPDVFIDPLKKEHGDAKKDCVDIHHFIPKTLWYHVSTDELNDWALEIKSVLTGENTADVVPVTPLYLNSDYVCYGIVGDDHDYYIPEPVILYLKNLLKDLMDFDIFADIIRQYPLFNETSGYSIELLSYKAWRKQFASLDAGLRRKIHERFETTTTLLSDIYKKNIETRGFLEKASLSDKDGLWNFDTWSRPPESRLVPFADTIEKIFVNIKYLGPLRTLKSYFSFEDATSLYDVGKHGENTVYVYHAKKYSEIYWMDPASESQETQRKHSTVEEAVTYWLRYFGAAYTVKTTDNPNGIDIKFQQSADAPFCGFANLGVGVTQIFPIVVSGLLAEPGDILIIDEPEVHLHPRMQTRLADFLISMALSGRQCLIETHSEYIIEQIRYRIASAPSEKHLENQVKIYFSEKTNGVSNFKDIKINKYAKLSEWPKGFFDESQEVIGRIMAAVVKKMDEEDKDG